ncbi:1-aminocyclopropane-1-carboxylate oxidase [Cajanus cajan]|uniref:1-aminocyclopropane-1-carboxylate oxidase 2 n=1 Tax=Cajanus cajan TaxID=3821 RepID=A0A151RVA1_CAJCA|nr:1-aminocyclopropane-1-carboxylate oxidase [Cajanus cajan]KYP46469.1 1-aminocyclopropane-1-carboxylate oxidase 2 [Cajanus cajan]
MAEISSLASQLHSSEPYSSATDEDIPTIDYSLLFSDNPNQQFHALQCLREACQEYGFFYLVNHTIPDGVFDYTLKGVSDFFNQTTLDEKRTNSKKYRWGLNSSAGENREYLKVVTNPQYHFPSNPPGFSKTLEEYGKEMRRVVIGLARAVSKTLGFEEGFIEKALNLKSGFDVLAMNLYPPNAKSKGAVGLAEHTDPGFVITLVQDVNGGLQILSHKGKWINAYIPHHAILIQLGDQLEILTNGVYKSHIHRVIVGSNKVQRISVVGIHGPSLDKFISPSKEFFNEKQLQKYRGMTYKESLKENGGDEIDVHSSLDQVRLM